MTNVKRSKSAMRSAIFGAAISWFALVASAQERSVELQLALRSGGVHYTEDNTQAIDQPQDLTGNSFSTVGVEFRGSYHAQPSTGVPFAFGLQGQLPLVTLKGTEAGHVIKHGATFVTQKEDVQHRYSYAGAQMSFEMIPAIQPFAALKYNEFSSRRTNQQDGGDDGTFFNLLNTDYTEFVKWTSIGFGVLGTVPLDDNNSYRVRYEIGYDIPQGVRVTNEAFDPGTWGQGTTGDAINARLEIDIPFGLSAWRRNHDGYLTIGGTFSRRHWAGDGRIAMEVFGHPQWPANTVTEAGAFIGSGVFF